MDYSKKEFYRRKITEKKLFLERTKVRNQEYEKIIACRTEAENALHDVQHYLQMLKVCSEIIRKENNDFKGRRIAYLNDMITECLHNFFPNEGFICNIAFEEKNRSNRAVLRLEDSSGFMRKPQMSEGKLCQYLISFAAVYSVVKSLGGSSIYVDEAFGVASTARLGDVGEILNKCVHDVMQIILVSHKADLYCEIQHREIVMHKDSISDSVIIDNITDYGEVREDG